jgi:hypothetical protein
MLLGFEQHSAIFQENMAFNNPYFKVTASIVSGILRVISGSDFWLVVWAGEELGRCVFSDDAERIGRLAGRAVIFVL